MNNKIAVRQALENITHYAEHQIESFKSGRPYLDMTLFPSLCEDARHALANDVVDETAKKPMVEVDYVSSKMAGAVIGLASAIFRARNNNLAGALEAMVSSRDVLVMCLEELTHIPKTNDDFDHCTASPTGKHSENWYCNGNCSYCNTGIRERQLSLDEVRESFIESLSITANKTLKGLGFEDPMVQAMWDSYLCAFNRAQMGEVGKSNLTPPEPNYGPPVAYEVWAGVLDMHPVGGVFRNRKEAEEYAASVKSTTEVRPLFRGPSEKVGSQ